MLNHRAILATASGKAKDYGGGIFAYIYRTPGLWTPDGAVTNASPGRSQPRKFEACGGFIGNRYEDGNPERTRVAGGLQHSQHARHQGMPHDVFICEAHYGDAGNRLQFVSDFAKARHTLQQITLIRVA